MTRSERAYGVVQSFRRRSRLALAAMFVPLVFGAELLLPTNPGLQVGIGEALGCSGGPASFNGNGWTHLAPAAPKATSGAFAIATDGFFVIDAEGTGFNQDQAQAGLQVVVTELSGEAVEGTLKPLAPSRDGWFRFAWQAKSPVAIGTELKLSLTGGAPVPGPSIGGEFSLVVSGEPTPLPEASLLFADWIDLYRGEGEETVSCRADRHSSCGPTTIEVPASVSKNVAASVVWQFPAAATAVAWAAQLAPPGSQPHATLLSYESVVLYTGQYDPGLILGRLLFPTPDEQCLTLVITDLRTDEQKRSEVCSKPQPTGRAETETDLDRCDEPPSDGLADAWCALGSIDATADLCGNGHGGSGGAAVGAGVSGSAGSTPAPTSTNDADDDRAPRTSKGCQLGGNAPSPFAAAAALGLGLALLARRRS